MIEKHCQEMAEIKRGYGRQDRLSGIERIKKYWSRRRLEAQVEAVRDQMSFLNLSNDWLDMEVKDHEEMDTMMGGTGAFFFLIFFFLH